MPPVRRTIVTGILLIAVGGTIAAAGCGSPCLTGASQCSDANTLQFCANRGTNLDPHASGNFWTSNTCQGANPYCVELSSGTATCAGAPTRVDECNPTPPGGWTCVGNAPGFCDDGFFQSSPTACSPPETVCTADVSGAGCVAGPAVVSDSGVQSPDGAVVTDAGDSGSATSLDAGDAAAPDATPPDAAPADAEPADATPDASRDGETPDQ